MVYLFQCPELYVEDSSLRLHPPLWALLLLEDLKVLGLRLRILAWCRAENLLEPVLMVEEPEQVVEFLRYRYLENQLKLVEMPFSTVLLVLPVDRCLGSMRLIRSWTTLLVDVKVSVEPPILVDKAPQDQAYTELQSGI